VSLHRLLRHGTFLPSAMADTGDAEEPLGIHALSALVGLPFNRSSLPFDTPAPQPKPQLAAAETSTAQVVTPAAWPRAATSSASSATVSASASSTVAVASSHPASSSSTAAAAYPRTGSGAKSEAVVLHDTNWQQRPHARQHRMAPGPSPPRHVEEQQPEPQPTAEDTDTQEEDDTWARRQRRPRRSIVSHLEEVRRERRLRERGPPCDTP